MKIILHMGLPKTGSTSLQVGLWQMRDQLARHGILYPSSNENDVRFHHILTALFGTHEGLTRSLRKRFTSIEEPRKLGLAFLRAATETALSTGAHTIVLSSEVIFPSHERQIANFHPHLAALGADIEPVVYVREPADLYKSRLQQKSKDCSFRPPYPLRTLRPELEEIATVFGVRPVVRSYHRDHLKSRDVVTDFCAHVLGLDTAALDIPEVHENTSMSAEAVFALLMLGEGAAAGAWRDDVRVRSLRDRLRWCPTGSSGVSPVRLKPQLVADIRAAAVDYVWLRDAYGISFPELDYASISGANVERLTDYKSPADVMEIDPQALAAYFLRAMEEPEQTVSAFREERRKWRVPRKQNAA